jgi:hypothetical protein
VSRGGFFLLHRFNTASSDLIIRSVAILCDRSTKFPCDRTLNGCRIATDLAGCLISATEACSCPDLARHQEIAAGGPRTSQSAGRLRAPLRLSCVDTASLRLRWLAASCGGSHTKMNLLNRIVSATKACQLFTPLAPIQEITTVGLCTNPSCSLAVSSSRFLASMHSCCAWL